METVGVGSRVYVMVTSACSGRLGVGVGAVVVTENNFLASLWDRTGVSAVKPGETSTMLPALLRGQLNSLFIAITTVQDLQPHLSTKWTGQTRLTNSQGAIHESWMARCSPRAPGFSREQYASYSLIR